MSGARNWRPWIIIGLVGLGVALAALLPPSSRDGGAESEGEARSKASSATDYRVATWGARGDRLDGGITARELAEDCDPIAEALSYEDLLGLEAHAILVWKGMPEKSADLKIPVTVVGIEEGTVGVLFQHVPMAEQFTAAWKRSGHIRSGSNGVYLLDPCRAILVPRLDAEDMVVDEDEADDALDEGVTPSSTERKAPGAPPWPMDVTVPSQ